MNMYEIKIKNQNKVRAMAHTSLHLRSSLMKPIHWIGLCQQNWISNTKLSSYVFNQEKVKSLTWSSKWCIEVSLCWKTWIFHSFEIIHKKVNQINWKAYLVFLEYPPKLSNCLKWLVRCKGLIKYIPHCWARYQILPKTEHSKVRWSTHSSIPHPLVHWITLLNHTSTW